MEFDTIILGAGSMGAAAAYSLISSAATSPPARVLALDRFAPPHAMGSHHGVVRMFRLSYFEHPAYVPWLRRALAAWKQMGCAYGQPLIHMTGALYMGRPDSELIAGCLRAIRAHGLPHDQLSHAELKARFPEFDVPSDFVGLVDHEAGYMHCERAIRAMLALSGPPQREGSSLSLQVNEPAIGWTSDQRSVTVNTAGATYTARNLVITAGPWAAQMLGDLGLALTVTRQVQGWLSTNETSHARLPCWAIDPGDGTLFYGFPALASPAGGLELKCARHARGAATTPGTVERDTTPDDAEDFMPLVRRYLPGLAGARCRTGVCLYTNSPDSHYIIDRHPEYRNVAFAAGFSGHGFKAAPAVGEILRSLVTDSESPHPEPFFSLARLARN